MLQWCHCFDQRSAHQLKQCLTCACPYTSTCPVRCMAEYNSASVGWRSDPAVVNWKLANYMLHHQLFGILVLLDDACILNYSLLSFIISSAAHSYSYTLLAAVMVDAMPQHIHE